ncbi:helix-turn-helix domain-containing protein [Celerinatantimonas sp. MCCC 1A17872]|uniref:helix-turn-helix domain-containing protein n=1 Tax=Celerinatantimonas sp. MCCC 1A17872 TaxID=3177514 RepID=UPI0038C980B1
MSDIYVPIEKSYLTHESGTEVDFHTHQRGQLTIAKRGSVRIQTQQGWWLAIPGTAIWVPAGIRHRAAYTETSELLNLRFEASQLKIPEQVSLLVVSALLMALAEQAQQLASSQTEQLDLIRQLLGFQLQDAYSSSSFFIADGKDKRLRAITKMLKENPGCSMTLGQLASFANSSQRTIARLFEKETQMSFTLWRERLRIMTAIERLIIGEPITKVAFDMGFQSSSSFSTAFRKMIGVPPSQYIRQLQTRSIADNNDETKLHLL